ncbi:hypothetical protein [Nocardia carnea]|uniref:hypothetical protein n=1 Tax=Nocardia carnea TaxID=37328 RepID=UPI0024588427|nr:hypothetical protein [Nocardia carnea]
MTGSGDSTATLCDRITTHACVEVIFPIACLSPGAAGAGLLGATAAEVVLAVSLRAGGPGGRHFGPTQAAQRSAGPLR